MIMRKGSRISTALMKAVCANISACAYVIYTMRAAMEGAERWPEAICKGLGPFSALNL